MAESFDYGAAMAELEQIAKRVEDPNTGLENIDRDVARSKELIGQCRDYLRGVREKIESVREENDMEKE